MRLIFLVLIVLTFAFGDDIDISEEEDICEDEYLMEDENGTTYLDSIVATSIKFIMINPDNTSIELNATDFHHLNDTKDIKFIIHGLGDYQDQTWIDQLATIYHTTGNYNVIALDWSEISTKDSFFVLSAVNSVGKVVANFIIDITKTSIDRLKDVHLIGKMTGAQIAGATGKTVAEKGEKLGRITALDPTNGTSLDENSAEFVDVIHTGLVLGERRMGTIDFYITNGTIKCGNGTVCEDLQADDFYIMATKDEDRFVAFSCYNATENITALCEKANGILMGEKVPRNATGSYLVKSEGFAHKFHGTVLIGSMVGLIAWYLCFL